MMFCCLVEDMSLAEYIEHRLCLFQKKVKSLNKVGSLKKKLKVYVCIKVFLCDMM